MIFVIYDFCHLRVFFSYIYTLKLHEFCEMLSKLLSLLSKTSHKRGFLFCEILISMWDLIINVFLICPCWKSIIPCEIWLSIIFLPKILLKNRFLNGFCWKKTPFLWDLIINVCEIWLSTICWHHIVWKPHTIERIEGAVCIRKCDNLKYRFQTCFISQSRPFYIFLIFGMNKLFEI